MGVVEIIRQEFEFLEHMSQFKIVSIQENVWGSSVTYASETTGIKLSYEFRESYLYIGICRLVEGQFLANPQPITQDSEIYEFDFGYAMNIYDKKRVMKASHQYPETHRYFHPENGMKYFIGDFAKNLKDFGGALLHGDFSILPEIKTQMLEVIRDFESGTDSSNLCNEAE